MTTTAAARHADLTSRLWAARSPGTGHVLLLEPDPAVATALCQTMRPLGVELVCVGDPSRVLARIGLSEVDAVVVSAAIGTNELMSFTEIVRSETDIPVLLASGPDHDHVRGPVVVAGARPIVSLPYEPGDLVRALRQVMPRDSRAPALQVGELRILPAAYSARFGGEDLRLGTTDFEILHHLAENADRVVPRRWFIERFWPDSPTPRHTLVRAMTRLRGKLVGHQIGDALHAVRGIGYQLESDALRRDDVGS